MKNENKYTDFSILSILAVFFIIECIETKIASYNYITFVFYRLVTMTIYIYALYT